MTWVLLSLAIGYLVGRSQSYVLREWHRRRYRHAYARALLEPKTAAFRHYDDVESLRHRFDRRHDPNAMMGPKPAPIRQTS